MKTILFYLAFLGLVLSCAAATYRFPPFSESDLPFGKMEIYERMKDEPSFYEKSVPELRSIMTFGDYGEQQAAAKILVQAGDQETMLRIVYSLKQGNLFGVISLGLGSSRKVIPYLMEDVAHGSMEDLQGRWPMMSYDKVRFAATEIVVGILNEIEDFPEATKEWLQFVESGNGHSKNIHDLSQKSKFLVEWWILNEKAFSEERWNDVVPPPYAGSYPPPPKREPSPPRSKELPPPPAQETLKPWEYEQLEVAESFEDWSDRIVHPERRDLRWVKLTFENGKWVEHSPIRLDPLAPPSAPSREVRRPAPPTASVEHSKLSQWPVWIAGLAMVSGLLFWWLRSARTSGA
jgi:hypothetical protein